MNIATPKVEAALAATTKAAAASAEADDAAANVSGSSVLSAELEARGSVGTTGTLGRTSSTGSGAPSERSSSSDGCMCLDDGKGYA